MVVVVIPITDHEVGVAFQLTICRMNGQLFEQGKNNKVLGEHLHSETWIFPDCAHV